MSIWDNTSHLDTGHTPRFRKTERGPDGWQYRTCRACGYTEKRRGPGHDWEQA
jgi:hypothetical protein